MGTLLTVTALLLIACSPQESAAEVDPCEDATTAAAEADNDMRAAHRKSQEGYLSHSEKQQLTAEARGLLFRWATIVDQNGDCFDASTRATAAQVLHELDND